MTIQGFKCIKEKYYQIFTLNIISKLLILFKDFLLILYVLNKLKLETFAYILGINIFITNILEEGITLSLIPSIQEEELKYKKKGRFYITNKGINMSIIISIFAIILFADIILDTFNKSNIPINSDYKVFYIILSINMFFNLARSSLVAYMQSDNRFFYGAKSKVLNIIIQIILIILLKNNLNLITLVFINLISSVVQFFYMLKPIEKEGFKFSFDFKFNKQLLSKISKMFFVVVFITIINICLNKLDIRQVKKLEIIDNYQVVRSKILSILNLFIMTIITITYPILTMSYNLKDKDKFKRNLNVSFNILGKFIVFVLLILTFLIPIVIKMNIDKLGISREEIFTLSTIIAIFSIRLLLNLIFIFFNRVYLSIKDYKSIIVLNILVLLLTLISEKLLVDLNSFMLSGVIYLLPFLLICLVCFISLNKEYKILNIN